MTERPGLRWAGSGVVVGDTPDLVHELTAAGVRDLAGPVQVDSSGPRGPMVQPAVVLALRVQMERSCTVGWLRTCAHRLRRAPG